MIHEVRVVVFEEAFDWTKRIIRNLPATCFMGTRRNARSGNSTWEGEDATLTCITLARGLEWEQQALDLPKCPAEKNAEFWEEGESTDEVTRFS